MEEICSAKSRCGSIIKPRLRAEGAGETVELSLSLRDGLEIFLSCWVRPIRKNSVLDGFRVRRLDAIQSAMEQRTF